MSNELVSQVIEAHGGQDRWDKYRRAYIRIATGGALWSLKGQHGVIDNSTVTVDLRRQWSSHTPFGAPGIRDVFTPDRVTIEDDHGVVLEGRSGPRESFAGHTLMESAWGKLDLAYFAGYAMWNYATEPFVFTLPGIEAEEVEPWSENGETWRRLEVTFPEGFATHSRVQTYYIDDQARIRRHDYLAEVLGEGTPMAAHYSDAHNWFGGILAPTRRRVYVIGEGNAPLAEPLLVSIDIEDITFE